MDLDVFGNHSTPVIMMQPKRSESLFQIPTGRVIVAFAVQFQGLFQTRKIPWKNRDAERILSISHQLDGRGIDGKEMLVREGFKMTLSE